MKLGMIADFHLGKRLAYRAPWLHEQEDTWAAALALFVNEGCQAVIFAGDATDMRTPDNEVRQAFQRPLTGYQLPVVAINGNHDVKHASIPTAIQLAGRKLGGTLHASARPELVELPGLTVVTLPHVTTAWLKAKLADTQPELVTVDTLPLTAAALLVQIARKLTVQARDRRPDTLIVVAGHYPTTGWATPEGFATDDMRTVLLPLHELEALAADFQVYGDIHKPGLIAPRILSPGSPSCLSFGEAACEHGCYVVDVEPGGEPTVEFHALPGRKFVTLDGMSVVSDAFEDALNGRKFSGEVVRARYSLSADQARRVTKPMVEQALLAAGAHEAFADPDVKRETRARVAEMSATLTPAAALDLYLSSQGINGSVAEGVRAWQRAALDVAA